MSFGVKNTTRHELFEWFCPHYCLTCGVLGRILCDECKNYNIEARVNCCLKCGVVIENTCLACESSYECSWVVGLRNEGLGVLVDKFKFESVRALAEPLAEMLSGVIPCLPNNTVVVPVPTIAQHVRERGLDHTLILAKKLAKLRGWSWGRMAGRLVDSVQVGASATLRQEQARKAYILRGQVDSEVNYLVVDDVATTGASVEAICRLLREKGARKVMAAVIAKAGD